MVKIAKGREIFLDLDKVRLYGSETDAKSEKVIRAIIIGIYMGDMFPPVPVCQTKDGEFELLRSNYGGGHHRALAHYRAKRPLRCTLVNTCNNGQKRTFIRDIEIVEDSKARVSYSLKKAHEFYRDLD
ncbi:MAG: hypothetical protein ABIH37_01540 [archaeon]